MATLGLALLTLIAVVLFADILVELAELVGAVWRRGRGGE
jgi:hypothetical protein